jgi:N-methylhydantoinase A
VAESGPKEQRPVYFVELGGFVDTPVYDRYNLGEDTRLQGPAVLEERECTIVVGPSGIISVDVYGNLVIDIEEK